MAEYRAGDKWVLGDKEFVMDTSGYTSVSAGDCLPPTFHHVPPRVMSSPGFTHVPQKGKVPKEWIAFAEQVKLCNSGDVDYPCASCAEESDYLLARYEAEEPEEEL